MDMKHLEIARAALNNVPRGVILFGYESAQSVFPAVLAEIANTKVFDENGKLVPGQTGQNLKITLSEKSSFKLQEIPSVQVGDDGIMREQRFGLFSVTIAAGKTPTGKDYPETTLNVSAGTLMAFIRDKGQTDCAVNGKMYTVGRGKNKGENRIGYTIGAVNPPKEGELATVSSKTAEKSE